VVVELALVEFLADSTGEVASVIAHELGHAHQSMPGAEKFDPDIELDADLFSMFALLFSGYDVYAPAGSLGKLATAVAQTGIVAQGFDNLTDPRRSFNRRMEQLVINIQTVRGGAPSICKYLHNIFHPHVPPAAPLLKRDVAVHFSLIPEDRE
jgi:hypothetical protein